MNYTNLQKSIDTIIGSLGAEKTSELLNRIASNLHLNKKSDQKRIALVATFIITKSNSVFEPIKTEDENYLLARAASYHLLRRFTPLSFTDIGKRYAQSKRATIYQYNKSEQMLSTPRLHSRFCSKYTQIEQSVLNFMTQI